jgi:hypothetical protein
MQKKNFLFGLVAVVLMSSSLLGAIACGDDNESDKTPTAETTSEATSATSEATSATSEATSATSEATSEATSATP